MNDVSPWRPLELLRLLAYNTAIALFLTMLTPHPLLANLIYSQCIGSAIYVAIHGLREFGRWSKPVWQDAALGIPIGFAVGFPLGTWANGMTLESAVSDYPDGVLIGTIAALLFGAIATFYFHSRSRILEAEAAVREGRLQRAEQEAAAHRMELRMLQAQIEPHFLFNTLSNAVSLIDTDPAAARKMLIDLTALLRTSLARTRRTAITLGEEIELLRAYLDIMAIRMGPRLSWHIEADDEALAAQLPPLLVQPLVENALRHGIEPLPAGGRLDLRCRRAGERLEIEVCDDGAGPIHQEGSGIGLANVRNRLIACYGENASLICSTNPAGGFVARLNLPYDDQAAPADR